MCGIAGMVNIAFDNALCQDILRTMSRRGPDDEGLYIDKGCALLHRRLAVRDPMGGKQPMLLEWANKQYIIVYNGELYNTDEIKNELIKYGHRFNTTSDTEVVLHGFAQWGEDVLHKMNGIFAFAVWEARTQKLFLARDRMGVKPLFYTVNRDGIVFASEIKSILCHPDIEAKIDTVGVSQLILLGPGRIPGSGIFKNIYEIEPGCCGWFETSRLNIHRYWKLEDREHLDSFEDTVEKVRWLVLDAINRQTVSDVSLGTFLSGGLDSSVISAVCADKLRDRGEQLRTFSVDYADNDKYFTPGKFQPESDNSYIELMRTTLNTEHYWTVLAPDDLVAALEASTEARDLPGMADVDFSLLSFCAQIKNYVKVALSGECADEIFGGYPWFRDPEIRSAEGFPWAQNTALRAGLLHKSLRSKIKAEEFVMDLYKQSIEQCDILPGTAEEDKQVKQMTYLNQQWFMQTLLDRKDRMSMYNGLEVRVPFCDHRIASYLYAIPWKMKNYLDREKGLLRCAMKGIVPDKVLWRKKSPYPKTFDPKYLSMVKDRLSNLLLQTDAPLFNVLDREMVIGMIDGQSKWPWYGQLMRTPQTIAYFLQINCWLKKYKVSLDY